MIGKYQLNFLEQDLRVAFDNRQKPIYRKTNFISGGILLIIQTVLSIRLGVSNREGKFHILFVSTAISYINLLINIKYARLSSLLIFVQTILLNISFTDEGYQNFVLSLIENKAELFLIGMGYGHLHFIIIQSFHQWYIRSLTISIICITGFFWSHTKFTQKLAYLVPLYLTTFFAIIAFYLWERNDKESFCLLFSQNRSLIDWQRIIKQNIPQSIVFVTRPKNKSLNLGLGEVIQEKEYTNIFCGKNKCNNLEPKNKAFTMKTSQTIAKNIFNDKIDKLNADFIEEKEQLKPQGQRKVEDDRLVFNFVNKKFYDQFQIKEWVDNQRKNNSFINSNPHYSFDEILNREDPQHHGNLICSESPIHQILFNNIFKNIIVSPNITGETKTLMGDMDNSADPTQHSVESTQTLSDYLKNYIEEKENRYLDPISQLIKQNSKTKLSKDEKSDRYSYSLQNPIKQLNCFYRPSTPFFVQENQLPQEQNDNTKFQATSHTENNRFTDLFLKIQPTQEEQQKQNNETDEKNQLILHPQLEFQISSPHSKSKNNNTAFFGAQLSNKALDMRGDIEAQEYDQQEVQEEKNSQKQKVNDKKDNFQLPPHQNIDMDNIPNQLDQKEDVLISPSHALTASANKYQLQQYSKIDEEIEYQDIYCKNQQQNSQQRLNTQIEDHLLLLRQNNQTDHQTNHDEHDTLHKQVTFSNNQANANSNFQKGNQAKNTQGIIQKQKRGSAESHQQNVNHQQNVSQNKPQMNQIENTNNDKQNVINNYQDGQENAFFFDTQMVRCFWGNEEGVLLIFNDVSLKIVNEKLREIERFKDKMLSTVTHDLKTPLNSIIMILENSFELGGLNKKQRKIILQNSQMLMSLINDILDYSQLRRDKFRLIIEEICLKQCIMDVVDLFEIQAEQKNIKISARFKNLHQEYIMQDERRIKQILVNLIGNALKFTQQEGRIDVIIKQKQIECIQISIKDTGTGISEQIQKKLFQFFNTFDHSERANNRHGIGLGLAICKQLNSQLGPWHEIKLKSKVDKGSKFTFCLYTNLIDHQQTAQHLNIQSITAPQKIKTPFDNNNHAIIHTPAIDNKGDGNQPLTTADIQLMNDQQQQIFQHNDNKQKNQDSVHYVQLPHHHSIHHIASQQIKQMAHLQNSLHGQGLSNHHFSQNNLQHNSRKSDFNQQSEFGSKNSLNKNIKRQSLRIEDIIAENKQGSQKLYPRDTQQSSLMKDSRATQKKSSILIVNPNQQHSASIIKLQDSKLQQMFPRRSIKREYIVLKGSRHKLLNSQKAFTMKIMMEDLARRKKSFLYGKSQTVDQFVKQKGFRNNNNNIGNPFNNVHNKSNKQYPFLSEKIISREASPLNNGKSDPQYGAGTSLSNFSNSNNNNNNRPQLVFSQTVNSIAQSIPMKGTNQNSTFYPSAYNSDMKMEDKKNKEGNQFETHLHRLQQQRIMWQEQSHQLQNDNSSKMFVKITPKNETSNILPLEANNSKQMELENNNVNLSENFGEIEELYKRYQNDQINEEDNLSKEQKYQNKPVQPYLDINVAQSIAVYQKDAQIYNNEVRDEQPKSQQYPFNHEFITSANNQSKLLEDFKMAPSIERTIKQHACSIYDSNKQSAFHSRLRSQCVGELKDTHNCNTQHLKEEDEFVKNKHSDNYDEEEDESQDIEDDDEEEYDDDNIEEDYGENDNSNHNKDMNSHLKYIENNIEKQMLWIQNDRKLQVEILKGLLQSFQKILIADDSPFNIFCLKQILSKNNNLSISVAFNGSEALNSYKQNKQQIIFMDLNMPVLDGYECLKCIRQYEEDNHIEDKTKVIVISAQEYEPFFSNFDGYLSKPIKLIDIISILQVFRQGLTNTSSSQAQI